MKTRRNFLSIAVAFVCGLFGWRFVASEDADTDRSRMILKIFNSGGLFNCPFELDFIRVCISKNYDRQSLKNPEMNSLCSMTPYASKDNLYILEYKGEETSDVLVEELRIFALARTDADKILVAEKPPFRIIADNGKMLYSGRLSQNTFEKITDAVIAHEKEKSKESP